MKKIIVLGASILQLPAIKQAKEMGLYVVAIDMDPQAIGFDVADEYYVVSTIDIEAVLQIARKIRAEGIITLASDKPMLTVAKVGEELGLNTISVETSIKVTNKARMRECLKEHNVPIPKFEVVNTYEQYLDIVKLFSDNKFIVKPADSSGSRGIFLVENENQIQIAYDHSKQYSSTGEVLVEEYMRGPEVSVESITTNGETAIIAVTDKLTTGAPNFVEMGHSQPSQLPEQTISDIMKVTKQAIKALGVDNSPTHTEIIITNEGAKIVEIGARLGGDNITTHLVPLSTGVNMVKACIELSLGIIPDTRESIKKASVIRYFDCREGTISKIVGKENAEKWSEIKEIKFVKTIGDSITAIKSSGDRVGFVISQSDSVDKAIQACDKAVREMDIIIE